MKKTISMVLCVILTLSLFSFTKTKAAAIYGAGKITTSSGNLNVRKSASPSASIITSLKKGTYVTLISKSDSFWYVRYSSSGYGYCSASYITVSSTKVKTVKTSSGNLNVRSGAGTSYDVKTSIPSGTVVTVLSTSSNYSKIVYNGTKTGYVYSSYLTSPATSYKAKSLSVPDFKQTDSRWANTTLGSSGQTIAKIGCATTALSMTESFRTGTTIYPNAMSKKLTYTSGGAVYWPENYTVVTDKTNYLNKIYSVLSSGKPVIIGAKNASGGQHYVVVKGVKSCSSLSASSFYINDPGSSTRTLLSEFLSSYPNFYKMLYY